MKLKYHNKISIKTSETEYVFYNTMFNNVYQKIANLDTFFDKIAIGSGFCEDFSQNYKLGNFLLTENLETKSRQIDPSQQSIYIEKQVTIIPKNIKSNYITEAGITSNLDSETNPDIYNYFSFITDDSPYGINISDGEKIIINITIYLTISTTSNGLLTKGNNVFLNLLLGNGCTEKNIYVARGNDNSNNEFIYRSNEYLEDKQLCTFTHNTADNVLNLVFDGDLKTGETNEIVFILDDSVFARINTKILQTTTNLTETITSLQTYVIDLGLDVADVQSVTNNTDSTVETSYFVSTYANNFSVEAHLPFNNLFNNDTPRFLSLEGDRIFFVLNDTIYMYKNSDYEITQVFASNIQVQNIAKITAFDDFMFVFTQASPCVYAYKITNNSLTQCAFDFSSFEEYSTMPNYTLMDIVQSNSGTFMLGYIIPADSTTIAYTLYLDFDSASNTFVFTDYVSTTNYNFTYLIPMHKNKFLDAFMMYCQGGTKSSQCRRAIHDPDRTVTAGYNVMAYYFTAATTQLYVKSRAVISIKNQEGADKVWFYYYPQVYRIKLPEFNEADVTYISTDLKTMIQQMPDGSFRAYNIIGYENSVIFSSGIPSSIDQSKILSVEFLTDTVLFFMDDETKPIIAYNLNIVGTCLENVNAKNTEYTVSYTKQEKLGSRTKGVTAKFSVNVTIWYFQIN